MRLRTVGVTDILLPCLQKMVRVNLGGTRTPPTRPSSTSSAPQIAPAHTHVYVSADKADCITAVVAERCTQAVPWAHPFHMVRRATDALDQVCRDAYNEARGVATRHTVEEPGWNAF